MPTIPPEVYGPAGLLVFLLGAVWRLWRIHEKEDARREAQVDLLTEQIPALLQALKDLSGTVAERLSEAEGSPLDAEAYDTEVKEARSRRVREVRRLDRPRTRGGER